MSEKFETAVNNPIRQDQERARLLEELDKAKTPWRMLKILKRLKKLHGSEVFETPEGR